MLNNDLEGVKKELEIEQTKWRLNSGLTPLWIAVKKGYYDIFEYKGCIKSIVTSKN